MQLKYKAKRIRDLFIYNTGIVPVDIQLKRHEIIVTVKESDLVKNKLTEDGAVKTVSRITGRTINITTLKEGDVE